MEIYNLQSVKEKYGVDLSSLDLNGFQKISFNEFVSGTISKDVVAQSVDQIDKKISEIDNPKWAKELLKKRDHLEALFQREEKPISTDQEDKWSSYFSKVDQLINQLDRELKTKLVSNVLINENPRWHRERNSLVHIKIVAARGLSLQDTDLVRSALFHDIAKFDTLSFNRNGWPTCQGHDVKGYELASGENELVRWICLNHMKIKGWRGDSESPGMKENTKREMFLSAPGRDADDKAKSFWKLCQFAKMDDMNEDFDSKKLVWEKPGLEDWDTQCPLRHMYHTSEFLESERKPVKVQETPFGAKELIDMGAKGPQIGKLLSQIRGKTADQAKEIVDLELSKESKSWIKSFERFRN